MPPLADDGGNDIGGDDGDDDAAVDNSSGAAVGLDLDVKVKAEPQSIAACSFGGVVGGPDHMQHCAK